MAKHDLPDTDPAVRGAAGEISAPGSSGPMEATREIETRRVPACDTAGFSDLEAAYRRLDWDQSFGLIFGFSREGY